MSKGKQADLGDLAKAAEQMAGPSDNAKDEDPISVAERARQEKELEIKLKASLTSEDGHKQAPTRMPTFQSNKPSQALPPLPVKRGRIFKPRRTVIYGEGGVGKSTAVADIDDVYFFDLNNGSEMLDVPRYIFRPEDNNRGHVPDNLTEFVRGIRRVAADPGWVKTVAVDLLTDLEGLAIRHIVERDNPQDGKAKSKVSLEAYGYGAGKQVLFDQMRAVCAELDRLTASGVNVVLIAHSEVTKFANPSGPDYAIHNIKALDHKEASVASYVFGWADEVGFMRFDDSAAKIGGGKKGPIKGVTGGNRVIYFDHSATHKAKSRLPLPPMVKIGSANPWSFMKAALYRAYRMTPDELRQEIQDELTRIGDAELAVSVDKAVTAVGDNLDKLTAYMQELRRRPAVASDDSAEGAAQDDSI